MRRRRPPQTRGLNPNRNRVLKAVFKGAALTAGRQPGAVRDYYEELCARGSRTSVTRVTVARKLAVLTLHLWKTGVPYDPTHVTTPGP